jgi:hypothetical protein
MGKTRRDGRKVIADHQRIRQLKAEWRKARDRRDVLAALELQDEAIEIINRYKEN